MPDVNVAAITPTLPANPNANNAGNDAVSRNGDAQTPFSQVLKDRQNTQSTQPAQAQQTPAKQESSQPPSTQEKPAAQASASNQGAPAKATDKKTGAPDDADASTRSPQELAQLLAMAGAMQSNATNTSNPDTSTKATDTTGITTDLASDTSIDKLAAASTGKARPETASLAAPPATTTNINATAQTTASTGKLLPDNNGSNTSSDGSDKDPAAQGKNNGASLELRASEASSQRADTQGLQASDADQSKTFDAAMQNAIRNTNQSASNQNLATHAVTQHTISTPVGHTGWAEDVAQRVVWTAHQDNGKAELTLSPANMGRIEVSINLNGDQANANFVAANPVAREALQDAMPKLRDMLAQAGIDLGQANVSAGQSGDTGAQDGSRQSRGSRYASGSDGGLIISGGSTRVTQGNGLVDTFA